jgi:hypothetical protein
MAVSPQRRRPNGSVSALRRGLFSVFLRNVEFVEDPDQDIEVRLRASTAAVQAGLAWARVEELHTLEKDLQHLEQVAHGNGHHR